MSSTNLANAIQFDFQTLEEAFPSVAHNRDPLLSNYLVQVRRAKSKTKGGLYIPEEARKAEASNCTVGKVVAIGPLCFKDPKTLEAWPEGASFKIGDYLQIPRFGGFRFAVKYRSTEDKTMEEIDFVLFDHLQQLAKITGDPRDIVSYL